MILQIFGILIFLFALSLVIHYSRIYGIDRLVLFLIPVLVILLVLVSFPYAFRQQLNLGFIRPLDAFLTVSSVSALLMCMGIYFRLRKSEKDLTRLVQELAARDKKP